MATLRRGLGERRIGHAGTLDPDATGLLLVAVGRSTRLLTFVSGADKTYSGELVLGATTDTLDRSGRVLERFAMDGVTPEQVLVAAAGFLGEQDQVPPMVSAVHVDGRRLYELAREGLDVPRPARRVRVDRFEVIPLAEPRAYSFVVACSSGTYVRSLVADLGAALGGGAYLRALRRERLGRFSVTDALPPDVVSATDLRPAVDLLGSLPRVVVGAGLAARVRNGAVLTLEALGLGELGVGESDPGALDPGVPYQGVLGLRTPASVVLLDEAGTLLAVYGPHDEGRVKPLVVHAVSEQSSGAPGAGR